MAADIEVGFDMPQGGLFNKFERRFNKHLKDAERQIKERVGIDAKEKVHRYKHDKRNLRDATKFKGSLFKKKGLSLFVDLGKAHYGRYIIKGFKSWAPDPFLNKAIKENYKFILNTINNAFIETVKQENRGK